MYRNTRFGQLMEGLPRRQAERIIQNFGGDKHTKGFRCWDQLVAMIYAQLSSARSLRELEVGFNSHSASHYHLGSRAIKRSTLADANAHRDSELFGALCHWLLSQAHGQTKRELKDLLYLLDSTPIPLTGRGFDVWTSGSHNHRTHGLKVHLLYASERQLPVMASVSAANVNDIEVGRQQPIEAGATYVFDKGYCDYNWWFKFEEESAFFVTRLKKNAGVRVEATRPLLAEAGAILEDTVVSFKHKRPGGQRVNAYYGTPLRRIVVDRPDKKTSLVLVTNDLKRPATELADLYRQRWGIELFFKWLKQNLSIKRFLGRSENAVRIQIYTALMAYLLVHASHRRQQVKQSLSLWLAELRAGLFQRPESEQITVRKRRREAAWLQAIQGALAL